MWVSAFARWDNLGFGRGKRGFLFVAYAAHRSSSLGIGSVGVPRRVGYCRRHETGEGGSQEKERNMKRLFPLLRAHPEKSAAGGFVLRRSVSGYSTVVLYWVLYLYDVVKRVGTISKRRLVWHLLCFRKPRARPGTVVANFGREMSFFFFPRPSGRPFFLREIGSGMRWGNECSGEVKPRRQV